MLCCVSVSCEQVSGVLGFAVAFENKERAHDVLFTRLMLAIRWVDSSLTRTYPLPVAGGNQGGTKMRRTGSADALAMPQKK